MEGGKEGRKEEREGEREGGGKERKKREGRSKFQKITKHYLLAGGVIIIVWAPYCVAGGTVKYSKEFGLINE